MKVGLSTSVINKDNGFDLIPIFLLAKKLKIDTVEMVISEKTLKWLEKNKTNFKRYSKNFTLFLHAYEIELNRLSLQSQELNEIFELCSEFDAKRLIIHPGFGDLNPEMVEVKEAYKTANGLGIEMLVENGYKQGELFKLKEEQLGYLQKIRNKGINLYATFDVWRAFKVYNNTNLIIEHLKTLLRSNLLKNIHLSDGKKSLGSSVALGEGEIDIDSILNELKDFKEYLILEVDNPEDAVKSVQYLTKRKILELY